MTDPAIIAASYNAEKSYTHNPDDVIDTSDAVGAWGTAKESTTELVDLSGSGNIADIHGAMPAEGFIQGRRFEAANSNYLNCGNNSSLDLTTSIQTLTVVKTEDDVQQAFISKISTDGYHVDTIGIGGLRFFGKTVSSNYGIITECDTDIIDGKYHIIECLFDGFTWKIYVDGILETSKDDITTLGISTDSLHIGKRSSGAAHEHVNGSIYYTSVAQTITNIRFNTIARLPFWSVNYTDYPDNVAEYTDRLPYSSSIISSGTFKVDDDKLQCVSAGTMTYSASYEFDGSEYIKVEIDGVEYAGTGTITQGNTTVAITQGSNKITIQMGTADTIDKVRIQFREEV